MSEVLSQSEIDALLQAMTAGEMPSQVTAEAEHTIRDYNFARPSKFNKDHLRTLENIFDNYSRLASSYLTGYLRTQTTLQVVNAEQVTYSEFSNSLINPVVFSIIETPPLKGSLIMELSPNISFAIIDRVLGGKGETLNKLREFSEIEEILMQRVIVQLLTFLHEPWEAIIDIKPKLDKIETNSQFAQIISPNEMVALVTISVKIGDIEGFIHFCLPHLLLEPIISRLHTKYWFTTTESEENESFKEQLGGKLEKTLVPIKALLGKTNIRVDEFVELQPGDIITLDSFIESDLEIMVGSLLKFYGKPGTNKGKNAIQITSVLRKEE